MGVDILIIEDESSIADNIVYALEAEGFDAHWANLGTDGLEILERENIDLIILDVGLPDSSGFEICKQIRKTAATPIIFLTARGDEIDRVVGFEIGGDDYVVKPFSPRELAARVKAVLRRSGSQAEAERVNFELLRHKGLIVYRGVELELTPYEYGILALLIENPEQVYSREQLMNHVWPSPEESFERAVDTHIKTIRAKLRAVDPRNNPLVTHRGLGYSLKISVASAS